MEDILFDYTRAQRIGLPEAIFCEGKSKEAILRLLQSFHKNKEQKILFTRLDQEIFSQCSEELQKGIDYHKLSRTAFNGRLPKKKYGSVAIVSGGTADAFVTWEIARTLEYLGINHSVFEDCGVAGLWRILQNRERIIQHDVIIAVAGLDAALATVLGGLCDKPIFAVPTSVGYGAARHGETALSSMLSSCAPGIAVLNIDNGYGAACAAARIIHQLNKEQDNV